MVQFEVTEELLRLDQLVLIEYGDLTMFDAVIDANPHLTTTILSVGDVVNLPVAVVAKVEEKLW